MSWEWKDPAVEPPPLRTRVRLRLSDTFRQQHRISVTCLDGYVVAPGTPHCYGFSTLLGPHVTGWMPLTPWRERERKEDDAVLDRMRDSLAAIGRIVAERQARKIGTWHRQPGEDGSCTRT